MRVALSFLRCNTLLSLALTSTLAAFVPAVLADDSAKPVERNPIFPGQKADPEVLYSQKTGRVYVYPTSEANGFRVFSTDNLVDWKDEGLVLTDADVSWETRAYWAPSIN